MTEPTRREIISGAAGLAIAPVPADADAVDDRPDRALMLRFSSLGFNCEFGVAQRMCGAEPLDLFRWANIELPVLERLLKARFSGIADGLRVVVTAGGECMVRSDKYGFIWHAWVKQGQMPPEKIIQREAARLPRLAEMMIDHLTDADRIFVRIPYPLETSPAQVKSLVAALHGYGPNTLMFVTLADETHPPGRVERDGIGLLRAHIGKFASGVDVARTTDAASWVNLCRQAVALVDG